jgi:prepilin-type N-terminal cleavage/methylation domain-containing protein
MKRPGFTLIETLLVLALAGLLVYGGAVSFKQLMPGFRLQAGAWEIGSSLNQARFGAIWRGVPMRVRFEPSGYALEIYDEGAKAWRPARIARLEGVTIRANNSPTFHPEGTVSDLATIYVSNARGGYKITVAISGRIKTVKAG